MGKPSLKYRVVRCVECGYKSQGPRVHRAGIGIFRRNCNGPWEPVR